MIKQFINNLINLLKQMNLVSQGRLLKNKIIELALKLDKDLIVLLLSDIQIKEMFFIDVNGVLVLIKISLLSLFQ